MNTRLFLMGTLVLLTSCNSFNRTDSYVVQGDREKWAKEMMGPAPGNPRVAQGKIETIEKDGYEDFKPETKPAIKPPVKKAVPAKPTKRSAAKTAVAAAEPATAKPVMCPMYTPPPLGKVPEPPFEELEKVKNNPARIDELERQYTMDLRKYISDRRQVSQEAQRQYLQDCQRILQEAQKPTGQ